WEGGERAVGPFRPDRERGVERVAGLVGHEPRDPQAARRGRLGRLDRAGDLVGSRRLDRADRVAEPERRAARREVVEARFHAWGGYAGTGAGRGRPEPVLASTA